jgi:putative ABC transport system permease protein
MDRLRQDLRFALRSLRVNPGFTVVALLTVALGIGVNTAIFSIVYGVLLRPLPYAEPGGLVTVWENHEQRDGPVAEWTGRSTFSDWRERNRTFDGMAAITGWAPNLTGSDRPEVLAGAAVSPGYFSILGVGAAVGRTFLPEEEAPDNSDVVVLSHELWQRRFGADPELLGQSLMLNGQSRTVIGILRPGFRPPIAAGAEIWTPLPIDPTREDRGGYFLRVVGRLGAGVTQAAALADMGRVASGIAQENPVDYRDVGVTLTPLRDTVVGPVRTALWVLLGAVGLVLLIACANVANLLLARASVRERELAVRAALGAARARLARQLLTESVVLAVAGGVLGLGLGVWGTEILVRFAPAGMPRVSEIGLHPTVFVFALAASILTGLLFGLAPALSLSKSGASGALREGARGSSSGAGARLRGGLVVVELAMGMAVLVAAGLLLRSFVQIQSVDPGFRVENTLSARILLPSARYPDLASTATFWRQLEERLRTRPGVREVGAATVLPLSGNINDISFGIEGRLPPEGQEPAADFWRATAGFFHAWGIPLSRGRFFEKSDRDGGLPVALISQSLADVHFVNEDPIGKRIKVGGVRDPESTWWTIVGVVGTVRTRSLTQVPEPEIFVPVAQRIGRALSLVVSTDGEPTALAADLRETVWSLDPDLPVSQLASLEDVFAASIGSQRFMSWLLGAFAGLALVLAAVGIYGVMAFMVGRRTREIGIRMALGARPADALRVVMGRGLRLTALGLALGLVGALAASRALSTLLFEVAPTDPVTLITVSVLLAGTALFACFWPARRATRVDPIETLRYE